MGFPEHVVERAWKRAGGQCECRRWTHKHSVVKCGQELVFVNHGREGPGRWEARRINAIEGDNYSNCEILCIDCYKRALFE